MGSRLLSSRCHPGRGVVALLDGAGVLAADVSWDREGPRCHRFAETPVAPGASVENQVDALARCLASGHLGHRLDVLGLDDNLCGTSLTHLPDIRGTALGALIARQVRSELPHQELDALADQAPVVGRPPADDGQRAAFLSWADRATIEALVDGLERRGISVGRVLPTSLALLDHCCHGLEQEPDDLEVVLRFSEPSVTIAVFAGGELLYARFLGDLLLDSPEGVLETGLTELRRTVAFVREHHRGRAPDRVLLSGLSGHDVERLTAMLDEQLDLAAVPLQSRWRRAPPSGLPERALAAASLLHHDLARDASDDQTLDLSPPSVPRDRWLLAGLAALILAGVGLSLQSWGRLRVQGDALHGRSEQLMIQFDRMAAGDERRVVGLSQRLETERLAEAGIRLEAEAEGALEPALESLLLLPPEATLDELRLTRVMDQLATLELGVLGDFTGPGGRTLQDFVAALAQRPWAADVSLHHGDVALQREDAGAPQVREHVQVRAELR